MPTRIDHVVIISDDLDTAVSHAEQAGFTVIPGGTHTGGLTHNALIAFADTSYIELIAPVTTIDAGSHRWFPRLRVGSGLVDYCLRSDDLDADVREINARGADYPAPVQQGRNRPDGQRIEWRLSLPPGDVGDTGWPFLIEDVTPRDLRIPSTPAETTHANGALGISQVCVLVRDPDVTAYELHRILGTAGNDVLPLPGEPNQSIALIGADDADRRTTLDRYGQTPVRIRIAATVDAETSLDPSLFSGAELVLEPA